MKIVLLASIGLALGVVVQAVAQEAAAAPCRCPRMSPW